MFAWKTEPIIESFQKKPKDQQTHYNSLIHELINIGQLFFVYNIERKIMKYAKNSCQFMKKLKISSHSMTKHQKTCFMEKQIMIFYCNGYVLETHKDY